MRRFPKFVAVVLAIAIIISSAMCLTTIADAPANTYTTVFDEDNGIIVTISSEGFLAAFLKLDIEGYDILPGDEEAGEEFAIAVQAQGTEGDVNLQYEAYFNGTALSIILLASGTDLTEATSATINIPVQENDGEKQHIALTHIQAADAGTFDQEGNSSDDEALLTFNGVSENGTIQVVNHLVCNCAEKTEAVTTEPTCTEAGVKTLTCNVCGKETTEPIDALGHQDVTYSDNGDGTHTGTCARCGEIDVNEEHIDAVEPDDICDKCGADMEVPCEHVPVADTREFVTMSETEMVFSHECSLCGEIFNTPYVIGEASTIKSGLTNNLDLGNDISLNFRYKANRFGDYDMLTLICTKEVYAKGADTPTQKQFALTTYTYVGGTEPLYVFTVSDVAAYEMLNVVNGTLYARNINTNEMQFIWSQDYSVRAYADDRLAKSTDEKLKVALVDLLNYGAAAQLAGNFNTSNLANAGLADEYVALATSQYPDTNTDFITEGIYSNDRPENFETLTPAGKISMTNNIDIGNKVDLIFTIHRYNNATSYDPAALTNIYYQFEYYTALGEKKTSDVIHLNTSDEDLTNGYINTSGKAVVKFSEGPLSTLSYPVTCTIYYGDPADNGQWVNRSQYSIESYIAEKIGGNDAVMVDLLKKMYAYGYSVADYAGVKPYVPVAQ